VYDVLLKDGLIVDPSQGIHGNGCVAIEGNKIAAAGDTLDGRAEKVFDMRGKIITPGLIDLHCHPVAGFWPMGVPADEVGVSTGVTLLCDAGSAGAANFEDMRRLVVERAKTGILCFLNLSIRGLMRIPEIVTEDDIDVSCSKDVVEANRNLIKGIKIRAVEALAEGMGLKAIEIAKKLSAGLDLPLMVHIGETRERFPRDKMDDFSRATVSMLEEGDILSHYLTWEPGGMILKDGTVYPELEEAQRRGVVLDSCHGLNHFSFSIARHAIERGLIPTVISTDMASLGLPVAQSLAVVMSKFLNLGLSLDQVIEMTTLNPARALAEQERRGGLKKGMSADLTVLELLEGDYLFGDGAGRETLQGKVLLEPRMVFRKGEEMPAFSRYRLPALFT
jgi:dihydroorotase